VRHPARAERFRGNGATDFRLELSRRSVGLGGRVAFVGQEKRQLRIDWQRIRLVPQVETALVPRDEQDVVVRIVRGKVHALPRRLLEPQRHQLFVVVPANRADRRTGVRTIDTRHKQVVRTCVVEEPTGSVGSASSTRICAEDPRIRLFSGRLMMRSMNPNFVARYSIVVQRRSWERAGSRYATMSALALRRPATRSRYRA
jgi:hypothetical protein